MHPDRVRVGRPCQFHARPVRGQDPTNTGGVVEAMRSDLLYIVPVQPDIDAAVALRLEDIRLRRNPTMAAPG